jgi:iron complex outermembrane receptor protein
MTTRARARFAWQCFCRLASAGVALSLLFPDCRGAEAGSDELSSLSLEELMNVEVTSVSKRPEKLFEAAAAIYVITREDIHRSGVTSIPEALRMAPGLEVGRVDAHNWAITSRGFNDVYANKLQVNIDGRSVYTPLFSGVFWDVQNMFLDDIERIEIIRGPGATLWGANAVNGVINVITRTAKETQGVLIQAGGGTEERAFGGVRYGGQLGANAHYRVYGQYFNRDDSVQPSGARANDGWWMGHGGVRLDWDPSESDLLTFQGDAYSGRVNQTFVVTSPTTPGGQSVETEYVVEGGNALGRWTHAFSEDSALQLQLYYDGTRRRTAIFQEVRDTVDLDVQQRFALGQRHQFVTGLGYRLSGDDVVNAYPLSFDPDSRTTQLLSAFLQDEITLVDELLRLTLGSKFEHNDFTGFEFQPGARLLWTPHVRHTAWASVSRAVRTPSRAEDDVVINQPGPVPGSVLSIRGDRGFDSEKLIAYEAGYRLQAHARASLSVAAFYNDYDDLRTREAGPVIPGIPLVIPVVVANNLKGETYGLELGPLWQVTDWWRLQATYSTLWMNLHRKPGSNDTNSEGAEGRSPHHQATLRSTMDLPGHWTLDGSLRYVDKLPNLNIPSYVTLDFRVAWRPIEWLEISVVGQNLLEDQHAEFAPSLIRTQPTEIERSVYGQVSLRF